MNPVEDNAGDIQGLALAGTDYRSWTEVESAFRRAITYRNRERKARRKEFRDTQRKWRSHRRPVWKRHYGSGGPGFVCRVGNPDRPGADPRVGEARIATSSKQNVSPYRPPWHQADRTSLDSWPSW